ncbi:MAG: carboxylating nicotinate-nucleotide diphosphorylase [Gemmatimonadales bacterium]|nr:MAG: carboxylating nicotinate-nucleotide diphosphorylase [Gemmatimonadales bacterium]
MSESGAGRVESLDQESLGALVARALSEDVGDGDRTTLWTVPPGLRTRARVVARQGLVLAGGEVVFEVLRQAAPGSELHLLVPDGTRVEAGTDLVVLEGPARQILTAERVLLNFLGRLSGVATLTRRFVDAVAGTGAAITDTRKTTPGLRALEKAAVRAGGGVNHRFGLFDMVLIKENHIAAAGGVRLAVEAIRRENTVGLPVVVEVTRPSQVEALEGLGVPRLLLDNMSSDEMRRIVELVEGWTDPRPLLEASGDMTLDRVPEVARTGVNLISVGALTHSAPSANLSLLLEGTDR